VSFDLSSFSLVDMLQCGRGIRQAAAGAKSLEDAAQSIVEYLYAECENPETAAKACALVRFYKTYQFRELEPRLQAFARNQLRGTKAGDQMKCLTLLATIGQEPKWRDRRQSEGHQAIPLPSAQIVEGAPMIAALIREMGLEIADVLSPQTSVLHEREGRTYNVFHVENAKGSPYIPAQAGFVERYGVRSVLGFGGLLADGEFFAVIMFSRGAITPESATRFRNIALDVKAVIHPFSVSPIALRSIGRSTPRA
jgi:hypothetical protein